MYMSDTYKHRFHRNVIIGTISGITIVAGVLTLNNGFNEEKFMPIVLDKTKAYKVLVREHNCNGVDIKEQFIKADDFENEKIISIFDNELNKYFLYDISNFDDVIINEIIDNINNKKSLNLIKAYVKNRAENIGYNNMPAYTSDDCYNIILTTYERVDEDDYYVDSDNSDIRKKIVNTILYESIGGLGGAFISAFFTFQDSEKSKRKTAK